MKDVNAICLGTVKLGMPDYGFSSGGNSEFKADIFLKQVEEMGIFRFDTSPRYGDSEEILGRHIRESGKTLLVSTKIDNLKSKDKDTPQKMLDSVRMSLGKLNLKTIDICYLHQNSLEIISDTYVQQGLSILKKEGLIHYSGASLYSLEECEHAVNSGIFDFIQVPVSAFDLSFYNRFIKNNALPVRFSVRSLLLQGILVNRDDIRSRIPKSSQALDYLKELDSLAEKYGLSALEMSLAFVFSLQGIDHYLIGTTLVENLRKDISCLKVNLPEELFSRLSELASENKDWVDPRSWKENALSRSYN